METTLFHFPLAFFFVSSASSHSRYFHGFSFMSLFTAPQAMKPEMTETIAIARIHSPQKDKSRIMVFDIETTPQMYRKILGTTSHLKKYQNDGGPQKRFRLSLRASFLAAISRFLASFNSTTSGSLSRPVTM